MKNSNKVLVAIATATASAGALAHPGHDHAANTAMLSHVFFYGGIVAGLAIMAFAGYQAYKRNTK